MVIKKFLKSSYMLLVLLFIYVPIAILIIYSFNGARSLSHFNGEFSLKWYENFFKDRLFIESIISSLLVAIISTIISVIIGTLAAIGISKVKKVTQSFTLTITNIPLINADVVTAVSLMMLFLALGFKFGLFSLILAHISFNIPYVIITILPKLKKVHSSLIEASLDLGASPFYTLRKIVLPLIYPAIIAATVISFAMSFDDFIISYFTGGSVMNVATYIYTLKRLSPVVNAFGAILIAIVSFCILSWNFYTIVYNQIKLRNQSILKEKYRAKEIVRYERKLLNLYLLLNNLQTWKTKNMDQIKTKIFHLEIKIEKEKLWIKSKKAQILRNARRREKNSEKRREKYYWIVHWPWRVITIFSLAVTSLGLLTFAYIKNNLYDFKIGIWDQYISNDVIKRFESENNIRIKIETYDKNEILYNKMLTTQYDLIVPSDYMAAKFVEENKVSKIDWQRLKSLNNTSNKNNIFNQDKNDTLWDYLDDGMKKVITSYEIDVVNNKNLSDYAVPYFWGDLVLLFNFEKPEMKKWIKDQGVKFLVEDDENKNYIIDNESVSWEIIWNASNAKKKVYALNDFRSLYGIAFQRINQTVNPRDKDDIQRATELLKELIVTNKTNFTLQSDEIIDTISAPYSDSAFDVALMYNGDAVASFFNMEGNIQDRKFISSRARKNAEGTNIWIDLAMIVKGTSNEELAYKFLQFILQNDLQKELSLEYGYNSPIKSVMQDIIFDEYKKVQDIYLPASKYNVKTKEWNIDVTKADGGFKPKFIEEITDSYNKMRGK